MRELSGMERRLVEAQAAADALRSALAANADAAAPVIPTAEAAALDAAIEATATEIAALSQSEPDVTARSEALRDRLDARKERLAACRNVGVEQLREQVQALESERKLLAGKADQMPEIAVLERLVAEARELTERDQARRRDREDALEFIESAKRTIAEMGSEIADLRSRLAALPDADEIEEQRGRCLELARQAYAIEQELKRELKP